MPNGPQPDLQCIEDAEKLIALALTEDISTGDVTCESVIPVDAQLQGVMRFRVDGVVSGLWLAERVFKAVDETIQTTVPASDGDSMSVGDVVLEVTGPARSILTAERTALNFLQRLSGVATKTRAFVDLVSHTDVMILDTRKTTPGYRRLEKYAVQCGGGTNHRMGLYDRVMIKDNHLAMWGGDQWDELVNTARNKFPNVEVQIEVDTPAQFVGAVQVQPDWILLDNMSLDELRQCVEANAGRTKLEASGGVTLDTVAAIAETGVDAISIGALTHSAVAVDIGLDYKGLDS